MASPERDARIQAMCRAGDFAGAATKALRLLGPELLGYLVAPAEADFLRAAAHAPGGEPAARLVGQTLGRYRVDSLLGRGGMGVVYLAQDLKLRRPVALNVLPPALVADAERRARFLREARSAAAERRATCRPSKRSVVRSTNGRTSSRWASSSTSCAAERHRTGA